MTKKDGWLIAGVVVLAGIYACFFTSWFRPHSIRIYYTTSKMRAFRTRADMPHIMFGLQGGRYRLTELKVVPTTTFQKDPGTPPLWHLVSDSNSVPLERFVYGQRIPGMRPPIKGEQPQVLETNVTYRLIIVAGKAKGWEDFSITD